MSSSFSPPLCSVSSLECTSDPHLGCSVAFSVLVYASLQVSILEPEFLACGGDIKWLHGLDHLPAKLHNLLRLNRLLAHQPWNVSHEDIKVRRQEREEGGGRGGVGRGEGWEGKILVSPPTHSVHFRLIADRTQTSLAYTICISHSHMTQYAQWNFWTCRLISTTPPLSPALTILTLPSICLFCTVHDYSMNEVRLSVRPSVSLCLQELLIGHDSWSITELTQAIVIMAHYHSLAGFALGCGITPEADTPCGHTFNQETPIATTFSNPSLCLTNDLSIETPRSDGSVVSASGSCVSPTELPPCSQTSLAIVEHYMQSEWWQKRCRV